MKLFIKLMNFTYAWIAYPRAILIANWITFHQTTKQRKLFPESNTNKLDKEERQSFMVKRIVAVLFTNISKRNKNHTSMMPRCPILLFHQKRIESLSYLLKNWDPNFKRSPSTFQEKR